jgi:hypothetical protein
MEYHLPLKFQERSILKIQIGMDIPHIPLILVK